MNSLDRDKKYLITGGAGFLGRALIARMINDGFKNLVVLSRNEGNLMALKDSFPMVEIVAGDIANSYTCQKACWGVDGVFHLAAFKHVRMAESDSYRCIESNIIGLINMLKASWGVELFVFISTDKAANVNGAYGATKFLGEKLIREMSQINEKTKYRIVRFGNVWGSTGSIATKWPKIIQEKKEISITDPSATRFYFMVDDAVDFMLRCIIETNDAKPMLPQIKAVSMKTVVDACLEVYGNCPVRIIGLQPGENLHETLDGKIFSNEVEQYTKDEFIKYFLRK